MQKDNISHWSSTVDLKGLLFFAQRLKECLFDYTLDTFKPRVLNTSILCHEALNVYRDVENNKIDSKNLDYLIEELNWSFKSDQIVKNLLGNERELFFPLVDSGKKNDLKLKLELLNKRTKPSIYLKYTTEFISESVKLNHKNDINLGIDAFVSTLKAFGFSQGYLYYKTHNFFFNRGNKINNVNQIDEFLECFILSQNSYSCIFKVSKDFEEISKTYSKFKISKIEIGEINNVKGLPKRFVSSIDEDNQIFIKCDNIKAYDVNISRKNSFNLLNKLSDYFAFYHHKEKFEISSDCIAVINDSDGVTNGDWVYVNNPTNPMTKGVDKKKDKAAIQLERFLTSANFEPVTFRKIDRAIDLHGLSIESLNFENQILNLWISLEMLIPHDSDSSKIQQITNTLVPFMTIDYLKSLLRYLASDITKWNFHRARHYFSSIPDEYGANNLERFSAFICLPEFKEQRDNLLSELDNFPLLRNRIFYFSQNLGKPKYIHSLIKSHEQKLFWHLRRIYRTRNQIIHDGKRIGYLETLVENGHNYLDTFLETIINMNIDDKRINTLEQGIKNVELLYNRYNSYLSKNKDKTMDKDNFLNFLFGR